MQIVVNTDNHIQGDERLIEVVESIVEDSLDRFADRLTRVEVHLTDENSRAKISEDDKRCVLEARPAGRSPLSVTHHGGTVQQAVEGAAEKLEKVLEKTLDRLDQYKGRTSFGGDQKI